MIELFRHKNGKKLCALCDGKVNRVNAHIILEIKGIPPLLFFFHIEHYKIFVESLKDYVKKNETPIIRNFAEFLIE